MLTLIALIYAANYPEVCLREGEVAVHELGLRIVSCLDPVAIESDQQGLYRRVMSRIRRETQSPLKGACK